MPEGIPADPQGANPPASQPNTQASVSATTPVPPPNGGAGAPPTNGGAGAPPTNGGAGTPPASSAPWYSGIEDADLRGYTELKAWKTPGDAVKSYRELESLRGVPADQLVKLPGKDAKPEDWAPVYDKMGRPKEAKDYNLPVPEGTDRSFADAAAPVLHGLGLTTQQAQGLAKWWNEAAQGAQAAQHQAAQNQWAAEDAKLHEEWPGETYTQRMALATRAAKEYGLDKELIDKIEGAIGSAGVYRLFARIGEGQGEAKFVENQNSNPTFGMTPEAARVRLADLKADKEFGKKWINGDAEAQRTVSNLEQIVVSAGRQRR